MPRGRDGTVWPGLRIYLTSFNGARAAALVAAAADGGARMFSLPILPLFGSFLASARGHLPHWKDLMDFADALEPLLVRHPKMDLRVHYQSLWTILDSRGLPVAGGEAPGHRGCQAASALGYVDPSGILYPCASLPVPIGRIGRDAIGRVWGGEEVGTLRRAIEEVPGDCSACDVWRECRGGCRGWSHFLEGSWGKPGPDCGRPREGGAGR